MADMTDSAFCQVVREVVKTRIENSRLIVFREMVSSEAVVRGNDKTLGMTEIHPAERPLVQQIFGANPDTMAASAKFIQDNYQPEGIDINMGCPVYKITSNFNGSALMKDPAIATEMVQKMKAVLDVPLSVKMRAGWEDHSECIEFAKVIEAAGADLITVHGRTKKQGYSGKSHRDVVAQVKQAVSIPVLYNGDVFTWEDYFAALEETSCDGVLIARGALGNPWIFAQIEQKLAGKEPDVITLEERITVVKRHLDLHLAQYGEEKLATFRKHMS
ncbi:MAG: tRNA-dihydrouridine synthase family protein, partial [Planctomycetaceae bacterium]|nr:tRNA-dihydrouridine synthase family protein [Planctomycetaceae bacterium]